MVSYRWRLVRSVRLFRSFSWKNSLALLTLTHFNNPAIASCGKKNNRVTQLTYRWLWTKWYSYRYEVSVLRSLIQWVIATGRGGPATTFLTVTVWKCALSFTSSCCPFFCFVPELNCCCCFLLRNKQWGAFSTQTLVMNYIAQGLHCSLTNKVLTLSGS